MVMGAPPIGPVDIVVEDNIIVKIYIRYFIQVLISKRTEDQN